MVLLSYPFSSLLFHSFSLCFLHLPVSRFDDSSNEALNDITPVPGWKSMFVGGPQRRSDASPGHWCSA